MSLDIMAYLYRIACKRYGHQWRKARKGEAAHSKLCKRCGKSVAVKKRKQEAA